MFKIKCKEKLKKPLLKLQNQFKSCINKQNPPSLSKQNKTSTFKLHSLQKTQKMIPNTNDNHSHTEPHSYLSIDSSNKIPQPRQKQISQHRRSIKCGNSKQPRNSIHKPQLQPLKELNQIQNQFKNYSNQNFIMKIEHFVNQIFTKLLQSQTIQQKSFYISIKKKHFELLLAQIFTNLVLVNYQKTEQYNKSQFSYLKNIFKRLYQFLHLEHLQKKQDKLTINHTVLHLQYNSKHFQKDNIYTKTITGLRQQLNNLQQQIDQKQEVYQSLTNNFSLKFNQHIQLSKKCFNLRQQYQKQSCKYNEICQKTSEHQQFLSKVEQEVNKIVNFNNTQFKLKILYFINQNYKNFQNQVFSYAHELQHNHFTQSPIQQPQNFKTVQKEISQKIEDLQKNIQTGQIQCNKIISTITQFLQNSILKLKIKYEQIITKNNYKTECINKFIIKMQDWTDNYDMKQNYLKILRKEFVAESQKVNKIFINLQDCIEQNQQNFYLAETLDQLKTIWKKRQENYQRYTFY